MKIFFDNELSELVHELFTSFQNLVPSLQRIKIQHGSNAEFQDLAASYRQLGRHLELEIIKAESAIRFIPRVDIPMRGKTKNREITVIHSCAIGQNAMSSILDVVH